MPAPLAGGTSRANFGLRLLLGLASLATVTVWDDHRSRSRIPRVARVLANLRRAERGREEPCVELHGLVVDLAARAVSRDGDEIHLTPIEFKLLTVLSENRGRLLTHNTLLQHVWGPAYTDARQTLRGHMANLRGKIEPADGGRLIHTDHGVGYRLATCIPRPLSRNGLPTK
jgi:DNA-binding winged helix-turn-helix (wHTH) protein